MSFVEKMKTRYTTKKYNPEKKISRETVEQLKQILNLSPSSINSQPWKFIFINDKQTMLKFANISRHNTQKVIDCSCLVVFQVINNVKYFEKQIQEHLPEGQVNYYKTHVQPRGEEQIKIWMARQVYISLGILLAACADMGIDSTPMEGIESDKYDEILNVPNYATLFAVTLGTRADDDPNQPQLRAKLRLKPELVLQEI